MELKIPERIARNAPRLELACGVLLIALGVFSRFYQLGHESIWLDEATTYMRASLPLPELLADTIHRHHVPPYFVILHYVLRLGDSEFMLRLPSAVFGSLGLLASVALGWIVAGARAGVTTGILFALAPQILRYCQEARMYTMFLFFSTTALCGLLWLVKHREAAASWPFPRSPRADAATARGARRAWLAYALGLVGVLYSHNTGVLFWAACCGIGGLTWLALPGKRKPFFLNFVCANVLVLLAFAPWLRVLLVQAKEINEHFWAQFPSSELINQTLVQLYLFGSAWKLPGLLALPLAAFGLFALRKETLVAVSLLLLSVLQPLMILVISLHRPIWLLRLMLWGTVPFMVLVACGVAALPRRLLSAATVAVIVASGASALASGYFGVVRKPQWYAALTYAAAQTGVPILLSGTREQRPIIYYTERKHEPVQGLEMIEVRQATLDRTLAGRRRVIFFIPNRAKKVKPFLEMMKSRGKLLRRDRYGHGLTLMEYRVASRYQKPDYKPAEEPGASP